MPIKYIGNNGLHEKINFIDYKKEMRDCDQGRGSNRAL